RDALRPSLDRRGQSGGAAADHDDVSRVRCARRGRRSVVTAPRTSQRRRRCRQRERDEERGREDGPFHVLPSSASTSARARVGARVGKRFGSLVSPPPAPCSGATCPPRRVLHTWRMDGKTSIAHKIHVISPLIARRPNDSSAWLSAKRSEP